MSARRSGPRRQAKLNKLNNAISKAEAAHEAVQKSLQSQYEESNSKLEKLQGEYKPVIKLLAAATPKK